jgi:hypothetical protein
MYEITLEYSRSEVKKKSPSSSQPHLYIPGPAGSTTTSLAFFRRRMRLPDGPSILGKNNLAGAAAPIPLN